MNLLSSPAITRNFEKGELPAMSRPGLYLRLLTLVGVVLLAAGCGQKGPLYLPDKTAAEQADDDSD